MKVLFLTGHRKSGTTLLSNLLDNVEGLCVYPTDLTMLYAYYPYFNNNKFSFSFKSARLKKIIKNSLKTNLSYSNTIEILNIEEFLNNFLKKVNKNNINKIDKLIKILISTYLKFFFKIFKKGNIKYFVLKETSCGYLSKQLNQWFKNIKIIQIIRDPRDNFASLKAGLNKYYNKFGEDELTLLSSTMNRLQLDFQYIKVNKKFFGNKRYKVIKYESLVTKQKKTTTELCRFLGIKYDKQILKPTILGKISEGNNFDGIKFKTISDQNLKKWRKRITPAEASVLEFFLKDIMIQNGYKISSQKHAFESIRDYYIKINQRFFFKDNFKT